MTAMSESDAMALQVTDVTKHYDSGFTLDDVTFDLPKGYIMGLIGPNGAGKSTLIKLILNMIHRDAGSIHVLGLDNIANEEPVKEQLGVVFDFSYMHEQWQVKNIERIVAPLYPSWDGGCYRKYRPWWRTERQETYQGSFPRHADEADAGHRIES